MIRIIQSIILLIIILNQLLYNMSLKHQHFWVFKNHRHWSTVTKKIKKNKTKPRHLCLSGTSANYKNWNSILLNDIMYKQSKRCDLILTHKVFLFCHANTQAEFSINPGCCERLVDWNGIHWTWQIWQL